MDSFNPPEEFECWVVFTDGDNVHWWSRFMKKGYRHCYVLFPLKTNDGLFGEDWTVQVEPRANILNVKVYTDPIGDTPHGLGEFTEVIKCRVANLDKTKYSIEVRTCVTTAKWLLGVQWRGIQTPWRFRNKLVKSSTFNGFL